MLYEQRSNGSGISAARSIVFTIGTTGIRLKQHTLQDSALYSTPLGGKRANVVQRMNLSVSAKRFGMNRNLMHTIAGHSYLGTDYLSVYGVNRIHTDSSDLSATIVPYADNQRTPNRCNIWGNALMTIKGMEDRDVFVYAVTDIMAMSGSLRVGFISGSRSETSGGSGGAHVDIVN
ncbi:MAG: hypothetical protein IKQ95_10590 [Synergistaceae bacterium]|nr:hypothetical protein [Synergistaceae bacterium]